MRENSLDIARDVNRRDGRDGVDALGRDGVRRRVSARYARESGDRDHHRARTVVVVVAPSSSVHARGARGRDARGEEGKLA